MKFFADHHIKLLTSLYEGFYNQHPYLDCHYPEWGIIRDIMGQIQSSLMLDEL